MTQERRDVRSRRQEQFAQYLRLMRKRMRGVKTGSRFLVVSACGRESGDERSLVSAVLSEDIFAAEYGDRRLHACDLIVDPIQDEGVRISGDRCQDCDFYRFVQFAFEPDSFLMDLPNTTLSRAEAAELLECRPGFFFFRKQLESEDSEAEVFEFDPVRRVYEFGDEATAADDMAFIWFDLWKFPADWRFYVTAGAFQGQTGWERYRLLDVDSPVPRD